MNHKFIQQPYLTLVINDVPQAAVSGAAIAVSPSDQIQILMNGRVLNPSVIVRTVTPPDVSLTLPSGQLVILKGFADPGGQAGGGLEGADGAIVIASTLEALSAPAGGGDGGVASTAGPNNISTFNQAVIDALGLDFGTSADAGDAGNFSAVVAVLGDELDPNDLLSSLLDADLILPLFTEGDDVVDLNDIGDILARTLISDLATLLELIDAGFNISDALGGNDTVILPEPGSPLFGLFPGGTLFSGAANDIINGSDGIDTLMGNAGEDLLYGGAGDDIVAGGVGNDTLFGGAGADTLAGDAGTDVSGFKAGDGGATLALADLITDFADGSDLIGLARDLAFGTGAEQAQFIAADFSGLGGSASDTALVITDGADMVTEILALVQGIGVGDLDENDVTILP